MNIAMVVGTIHVFPSVSFRCVRTRKEGCCNKRVNNTIKIPALCKSCRSAKMMGQEGAQKGA